MSEATKRKSETQAATWLTPEQIEEIRDAAMTTGATYLQERNETIIAVLADTGLRNSELCALDWEDLHLEGDGEPYIYLPESKQKGAPGAASIDLSTDCARQLRRYKRNRWKETQAVFPSREKDRISPRSVRNVVTKVAVEAGVRPQLREGGQGEPEEVHPHTFRHSIAYRLIRREGKRLEDVQLRLRHSKLQTTDEIYGHLRRR